MPTRGDNPSRQISMHVARGTKRTYRLHGLHPLGVITSVGQLRPTEDSICQLDGKHETGNTRQLQPFPDAKTTTEYGYELTSLWQEDTLLVRSINHELTGTITFREVQEISSINLSL